MDSLIKADLYRYFGKTNYKTFIYCLARVPGFRFMYIVRKAKRYRKYSPLGILYRIIYDHFSYKYGFQIPLETQIGGGFYIGHFGTIIINPAAIIGENCNIAPGVTIGQANRGSRKGAPVVGNKVWIGTGAILVGKITIGDNVLIAPNSYVNFDIPANSLVLGNPGQIIPKDEDVVSGYIENTIGEDFLYNKR